MGRDQATWTVVALGLALAGLVGMRASQREAPPVAEDAARDEGMAARTGENRQSLARSTRSPSLAASAAAGAEPVPAAGSRWLDVRVEDAAGLPEPGPGGPAGHS